MICDTTIIRKPLCGDQPLSWIQHQSCRARGTVTPRWERSLSPDARANRSSLISFGKHCHPGWLVLGIVWGRTSIYKRILHTDAHIHIYTHTHIYISAHTHRYIYIYIYIHTHKYIYIYIYIHNMYTSPYIIIIRVLHPNLWRLFFLPWL